MVEIIIGFISGIFSGIGMGGGTILILLLSTFGGIEQNVAQATNLIFFIPTAIAAIIISMRNKNINYKIGIVIIICGIIGAIVGASISTSLDVGILRKLFGTFIITVSIYESYSWYKMYIKSKK